MKIAEIEHGNRFVIGSIIVEPNRNILSHGTDVFVLEPKIMDVLEYLATHQGRVCSRDEIIAKVWKVEYGADESLTRAISVIRRTLRQAGGKGQYIQTISKRGYSLQEPISKLEDFEPAPPTYLNRRIVKPPSTGEKSVSTETFTDRPKGNISKKSEKLVWWQRPISKALGIIAALIIGTYIMALAWQGAQPSENFGGELNISPYGRSVAVIPFVDMSVDEGHQYFSDGIAEELSNELRKINALRIVGQRLGAVNDYNDMSYEEVGGKLKVSHVIHGSVRTQDEKVRITARLINTQDNSHVWSSNYDGTLDDVLELQQRVASDIVFELSLVLSLNFSEPINLEEQLPMSLAPDLK